MDPNETLKVMQFLAQDIVVLCRQTSVPDHNVRIVANRGLLLAQAVRDLDEWLQKGGCLPLAWQGAQKGD